MKGNDIDLIRVPTPDFHFIIFYKKKKKWVKIFFWNCVPPASNNFSYMNRMNFHLVSRIFSPFVPLPACKSCQRKTIKTEYIYMFEKWMSGHTQCACVSYYNLIFYVLMFHDWFYLRLPSCVGISVHETQWRAIH